MRNVTYMDEKRRLLVVANETIAAHQLFEMIRRRVAEAPTDVLLVAPALTGRLQFWLSDEDTGDRAARERLAASLENLREHGIEARGAVGDADPLLAMDDAMRTFAPTEMIVATHAAGRSNWLERGLVEQARERFDVPIVHVEVLEPAIAVTRMREQPDPAAPAREGHELADWLLFVLAGVLAIGGTVLTASFVLAGMGETALVWWVIFGDLGLKIVAFVIIWVVFQRRARADRLDY